MIASVGFSASKNADFSHDPFVELCFPVRGKYLPAEHCYALFAACARLNPEIHQLKTLSILSIPGFPDKQGKISLTERSCLRLRTLIPQIPLVYKLALKSICLGVHQIQIGIPEIFTLKPANKLKSRIVVIKGYSEPQAFLLAAQRQLDDLEISG